MIHTVEYQSPYVSHMRIGELVSEGKSRDEAIAIAIEELADLMCPDAFYLAAQEVLPRANVEPPPPVEDQFIHEYRGCKFLVTVVREKWDIRLTIEGVFRV